MTGLNVAFVRGNASKFSDTCDRRKFKSSVKYEEYLEPAFGLRTKTRWHDMPGLCSCSLQMEEKWKTHEPSRYTILTGCLVHLQSIFS